MISIPFSGSKRLMVKRVEKLVQDGGYTVAFEPFAGSAVLTVNLYNDGLIERGVINDYDELFDLYPEYLNIKDDIVSKCYAKGFKRCIIQGRGYSLVDGDDRIKIDSPQLPPDKKEYLQSLIAEVDEKYWPLLATGYNFTFPNRAMDGLKLKDFCYFARILSTDKQRYYMSVVNKLERDSMDWSDFIEKHRDSFNKNTLLIVDPPYIGTKTAQYIKGGFTEDETQKLVNILAELQCDFIFFNADKDKMANWMDKAGITDYTFETTGGMTSSSNRRRSDYMIYKRF